MKRYVRSSKDFLYILQDEIDYVNSIKYNSAEMKCTKSDFVKYISWWLEDLIDSNNEADITYHKEFYLPQIYKKKYIPLI